MKIVIDNAIPFLEGVLEPYAEIRYLPGREIAARDVRDAAALIVRWLTESERNLDFVAQTGYMPVRNGAFDAIENYDKFPEPTESYRQLYAALKIMQESYTPLSEPRFEGYYGKVSQLYDGLRKMQQELPARAAAGESIDTLAEETWALLCAIH